MMSIGRALSSVHESLYREEPLLVRDVTCACPVTVVILASRPSPANFLCYTTTHVFSRVTQGFLVFDIFKETVHNLGVLTVTRSDFLQDLDMALKGEWKLLHTNKCTPDSC